MRPTLILIALTFLLLTDAFCQNAVTAFSKYDIRYSSCEILNTVNNELIKNQNSVEFLRLKNQEQLKYPLDTHQQVDQFVVDFNNTLDYTKKKYESQEFLWKTGREFGKYGLSVLGKYAEALPTKTVTNFLTPAIEQGYELYVDNEINESVERHKADIDQIIKDRINLLYTNGIDLTTASDDIAFNNIFTTAHGDIPAIDREHYGSFALELTKHAYDFIDKNRKDIHLINLRTTQQYKQVKKDVDIKIASFQTEMDDRFKTLGNSLAILMQNQSAIFKTLETIQDNVYANQHKIKELETAMMLVQGDIIKLNAIQEDHSRLLAQNSFQIDILSGYAFQNLNTKQKIDALNRGDFNNIFNDAVAKNKLIGELEEIRKKETIIGVSNDIDNYSKSIYGTLVNTGALKGKEAQAVGKFISVVSLVTGASRLYAGDLSGLTSIVSGLGGLFGTPKPSPEMQMLNQIVETLNTRFDNVDERLKQIDTKIDTLSRITFSMYKTMLSSFQYTGNELDKISRKQDYLQKMESYELYKDFNNCKFLRNSWEYSKDSLNTYSDLVKRFGPNCNLCLTAINNFLAGDKVEAPFYFSSNPNHQKGDIIDNEINDIYEPTKTLFLSYYDNETVPALYALMFPFKLTKDSSKPLTFIKGLDTLKNIAVSDVLDDYYNYTAINEVSENIIAFSPFFEISGNSSDFTPRTLTNYLENDIVNRQNQRLQEQRLLKMLDVIQYAIVQQSLLSGNLMLDPIYSSIFVYSINPTEFDLAVKVLNNNQLLARNFAILLINRNVNLGDTIAVKNIFLNAANNKGVDALNKKITNDDFQFIYKPESKRLYVSINRKGKKIEIICPEFSSILENNMINSSALYQLLDDRDKINSKLIDLTFSRGLNVKNESLNRFKYFYKSSSATKN